MKTHAARHHLHARGEGCSSQSAMLAASGVCFMLLICLLYVTLQHLVSLLICFARADKNNNKVCTAAAFPVSAQKTLIPDNNAQSSASISVLPGVVFRARNKSNRVSVVCVYVCVCVLNAPAPKQSKAN